MHQLRGVNIFIKNKIFSYSMDETWEDVLKDLLEDWKYKAFKCKKKKKKKSLPTYLPADSVGRQCRTNNILRMAQCILIFIYIIRKIIFKTRKRLTNQYFVCFSFTNAFDDQQTFLRSICHSLNSKVSSFFKLLYIRCTYSICL